MEVIYQPLASFLIPGDWNIRQHDWTSIERYSSWRGSGGVGHTSCQEWWLQAARDLIQIWWVSQWWANVQRTRDALQLSVPHKKTSVSPTDGCSAPQRCIKVAPGNLERGGRRTLSPDDEWREWCRQMVIPDDCRAATAGPAPAVRLTCWASHFRKSCPSSSIFLQKRLSRICAVA